MLLVKRKIRPKGTEVEARMTARLDLDLFPLIVVQGIGSALDTCLAQSMDLLLGKRELRWLSYFSGLAGGLVLGHNQEAALVRLKERLLRFYHVCLLAEIVSE